MEFSGQNVFQSLSLFYTLEDFPGGKEPTCQCRILRFHPLVGKIPWRKKCNPLQYSCLGSPRSLAGYSPWGWKELDRTQQLNNHQHHHALRMGGQRELPQTESDVHMRWQWGPPVYGACSSFPAPHSQSESPTAAADPSGPLEKQQLEPTPSREELPAHLGFMPSVLLSECICPSKPPLQKIQEGVPNERTQDRNSIPHEERMNASK